MAAQDFNAPSPDRPGVTVGEDLADKNLALAFQLLTLQEAGDQLQQWLERKLASPHRPGEDEHRDGFCCRCADLYVEGMRVWGVWRAARKATPDVTIRPRERWNEEGGSPQ
jgi:hypothetical protein